ISVAIQSTIVSVVVVRLTAIVACSAVTDSAPTLMSAVFVEFAPTVTAGGDVNLPVGKLTVAVSYPFCWSVTAIVTRPAAMRLIPDMDPSALNVSGPHLPDPSPRTTTFPFVDRNTAGSAFGKLLLVGGWKNATPVGSGVEVTFSATFSRAQLGLAGPR